MGIYARGKIKGKKEIEAEFFINSGSDVILLPKKVAEKIEPKLVGEVELILADGSKIRRDVYEVEVELEDSKGRRKRCTAHATIEEREDIVISFEVLEKLETILDAKEKTITFKS